MKPARLLLLLSLTASWPLAAQTWDSSGNGMLKGTYYFRYVYYEVGDDYGDLSDAGALYNTITFDGNGNYSISGTLADYQNESLENGTLTGTYSISASGYGFLANPLSSGDYIYGSVSQQGIFLGSSTESSFNDLFIAAPVGSPAATNSTFSGTYQVAYMTFPAVETTGGVEDVYDASFQLTPNGSGSIGTVSMSGYVANSSGVFSKVTTSASGVTYAFSNGAANVKFPNSTSNLVAGQEYLYISPDGNFIFGGSPTNFDMFVGVRTSGSAAPNLSGIYYEAGIDQDESTLVSDGYSAMDTYYGSINAGGGNVVGHERIQDVFNNSSYSYTFGDTYSAGSASYTDTSTQTQYVVGAGGAVRIGIGVGPYLGIAVALAAPNFSGSGIGSTVSPTGSVYIYPNGVVNAASSAPFTAGVSRGEVITIYGSGLAPSFQETSSSSQFPTTLNGVQVMINGIAAPLYYVEPGQVAAIVPYEISEPSTTPPPILPISTILVINNGVPSNTVTAFVNLTTPGIFTYPTPGGLGVGAMLHQDYSIVTEASPAQLGETVQVYVTGLGDVSPGITDGAAGPSSPNLSETMNTFTAYLTCCSTNGPGMSASTGVSATATVQYEGLAPTLAGKYQINVTIPTTGVSSGDNILEFSGPDSDAYEAIIPIGTSSVSTALSPVESASSAVGKRALSHHGHALRSGVKSGPMRMKTN